MADKLDINEQCIQTFHEYLVVAARIPGYLLKAKEVGVTAEDARLFGCTAEMTYHQSQTEIPRMAKDAKQDMLERLRETIAVLEGMTASAPV